MSSVTDWVVVAHLLRPQGRRGELLAELHTDLPERFADRRNLILIATSHDPTSVQPVELESHWLPVGKNAGRIVLKFKGIDSISQAESIADLDVVLPADQRVTLEEGTYYVSDLIGCTIADEDRELGIVVDVHFPTSTAGARLQDAAPILSVKSHSGDEILIPLVRSFLHKPDIANKRIEVRLPPGLLDING